MFDVKLFIVKIAEAAGEQFRADQRGNMPLILIPLKGFLPRRARVLNGTIAERAGVAPGYIFAVKVIDNGEETYTNARTGEKETGIQYNFEFFGEPLSLTDALVAANNSKPVVVKAEKDTEDSGAQTSKNEEVKSKEAPV